MNKGLLCVLIATALWGFAFLSPKLLPTFNSLEIVIGRYFFFGSFSLILMLKQRSWNGFKFKDFKQVFLLAITSNILFYSFLVLSLRLAGGTLGSLIVGLLPVSLSLYGNFITKDFSFKLMVLPLIVIFLGLITLNIDEFILDMQHSNSEMLLTKFWGVLCGMIGLVCWTWYGVANAQYLKKNPQIKTNDWATLMGVSSLIGAFLLFSGAYIYDSSIFHISELSLSSPEMTRFILISFFLGIFLTWIPTLMWNKASLYLPVPLLGQLIVFEPTFALIYNYLYEMIMPSILEFSGILLVLGGSSWSLYRINKVKKEERLTTKA